MIILNLLYGKFLIQTRGTLLKTLLLFSAYGMMNGAHALDPLASQTATTGSAMGVGLPPIVATTAPSGQAPAIPNFDSSASGSMPTGMVITAAASADGNPAFNVAINDIQSATASVNNAAASAVAVPVASTAIVPTTSVSGPAMSTTTAAPVAAVMPATVAPAASVAVSTPAVPAANALPIATPVAPSASVPTAVAAAVPVVVPLASSANPVATAVAVPAVSAAIPTAVATPVPVATAVAAPSASTQILMTPGGQPYYFPSASSTSAAISSSVVPNGQSYVTAVPDSITNEPGTSGSTTTTDSSGQSQFSLSVAQQMKIQEQIKLQSLLIESTLLSLEKEQLQEQLAQQLRDQLQAQKDASDSKNAEIKKLQAIPVMALPVATKAEEKDDKEEFLSSNFNWKDEYSAKRADADCSGRSASDCKERSEYCSWKKTKKKVKKLKHACLLKCSLVSKKICKKISGCEVVKNKCSNKKK